MQARTHQLPRVALVCTHVRHSNVRNAPKTNLFNRTDKGESSKGKGKAVLLQAWIDPEGSRKLRLPDFVTTEQDGSRLSALCTGRILPPGNTPATHFC